MNSQLERLIQKLGKVATVISKNKPELHFFGLVQRDDGPPDRWDLLVSSDQLEPWSIEAIKYVVDLLKRDLTVEEMVKISQVVALPHNNHVVTSLSHGETSSSYIAGLRPIDGFDKAIVIWPKKQSHLLASTS